MKKKLFLLLLPGFFATHLLAQARPLAQKTVVTAPATKPVTTPKPAKTENPPPKPTDLQNAVINIVVGNDGKDKDTYVSVAVKDANKRTAAYYGIADRGSYVQGMSTGEYFTGDNETLPTKLDKSVPTGVIDNSKFPPLAVTTEATLSDFSGGGSILMVIKPTGHDKWNISSFTVTLYFNNDPGTPHRMTWNGFTLSQDSPNKTLEFDKNFNPIQ